MGFLRRLSKGRDVHVEMNVTWFTKVRDDAVVAVVGEAFRHENVLRAAPPGPNDLPPGLPPPPPGFYKALLVREPTNPYDPNAIKVALWAGAGWDKSSATWTHVGYLSREDAALYVPIFQHLARDGSNAALACDAAKAAERGGVGVILHLGTPGECMVELITDDRNPSPHPWTAAPIVFTGRSRTTITGVVIDRPAQLMLARWAGCEVLPRLTKKAATLVVADPDEPTANLQKAREYGIPIVQEPDFLVGIGIPPEAVGRDQMRWARS